MATTDASEQLKERLRADGRRVTPQRLLIYEQLRRCAGHLTAEEIHHSLSDALAGISLPTIYATLDILVELGLARRLDAGPGATLYETSTPAHDHTVCRACGRIEDLDVTAPFDPLYAAARRIGFSPEGAESFVFGRCRECAITRR